MMCMMRMAISMADRLAEDVRREAGARGLSVRAFIARIVDDALKRPEPTHAKPFRLITVGGNGPPPGVDLDRPRRVAMLDTKRTCRDRWRQVLNEADRIPNKHLLTLQEGATERQFEEMTNGGIHLVVPAPPHKKFLEAVRPHLSSVRDFIALRASTIRSGHDVGSATLPSVIWLPPRSTRVAVVPHG
ncbi:MAG: hypothetical protein F4228_14145 [Acidobacteria bacterium]|nr:hypothetical protein [Acidobacteriota bacterium]